MQVAWVFYFTVTVVGSFFAVNLLLAVVTSNFAIESKRIRAREMREKVAIYPLGQPYP